ncbi:MAG TPA: ferritin-like domain-containing protein [Thermoleophilaceae bacterium]|jgi:rubrerythrin
MTHPSVADIQVHGITRGAFLARAALAAGALYGATGAGTAFAHEKHGAFSGGDIGIANFALTLERIEAEFYKRALAVRTLSPRVRKVLETVAKDENAHVQSLTQAIQQLGGKADPAPQVNIPELADERQVLSVAADLEDVGVSAYNGAATQIRAADLLQAAASIAQVEARHAGALRELSGQFPTVGPFDAVLSGEQADAAVHRLTS